MEIGLTSLDIKDAHFTWKDEILLLFQWKMHISCGKLKLGCLFCLKKLELAQMFEDAHFTWKVETWLCVSVEIVARGSDVEDAHFC